MSAVSKKLMPASSAAWITRTLSFSSIRHPKLLQPRPTAVTFSDPIWLVFIALRLLPARRLRRGSDCPDHAAVHPQRRTGGAGGEWARQVSNQMRDLLGRLEALEQRRGPHVLEELALHLLRRDLALGRDALDELPDTFRAGGSRQHRVHRHAGAGHALRQPARYRQLRGLGHAVVDHLGRNLQRRLGRNEDRKST